MRPSGSLFGSREMTMGAPGLQPFIHISAPWVEHLDECPRSENALAGAHNAMRELVNSGARCTHIRPFPCCKTSRCENQTFSQPEETWKTGGGDNVCIEACTWTEMRLLFLPLLLRSFIWLAALQPQSLGWKYRKHRIRIVGCES